MEGRAIAFLLCTAASSVKRRIKSVFVFLVLNLIKLYFLISVVPLVRLLQSATFGEFLSREVDRFLAVLEELLLAFDRFLSHFVNENVHKFLRGRRFFAELELLHD